MKLKYLVATSVAALLSLSVANAADLSNNKLPASVVLDPAVTWAGLYGGLQFGYATTEYEALASQAMQADSPVNRTLKNTRGALPLGLFLGYNSLYHSFVVGAELDAQAYFLRALSVNKNEAARGFADVADVNNQANVALRARVGVPVGKVMPYLALGITGTYVQREVAAATPQKDVGLATAFEHDSFNFGWTIGGGVELALVDNLILRVEYRYNEVGKDTWEQKEKVGGQGNSYVVLKDLSYSSNEFRIGLGVKY